MAKIKQNLTLKIAGFIEIELIATLIIFSLIISASFSLLSISKAQKSLIKNRMKLVEISNCAPSIYDSCNEITTKYGDQLTLCKKNNSKAECSYVVEK